MIRAHKEIILLIAILIVAAFLRFWKLGVVPAGVTNDELGYIYNAYSLATTGRNVFGEFLPLFTWVNQGGFPFLPLATYLPIPFYWLFGLSATIGRLPAAILGVGDVLLVYTLTKLLFKKSGLALLSGLFLAISPWHLHFSRSAYDPNFSLFFYLLGILLFVAEAKKGRIPLFSTISFLLAIYSYRGMNIILFPLSLLLIWFGVTVLEMKRRQWTAFVIGIAGITASLFIVIMLNGKAYLTAEGSIFGDMRMQQEIDTQIREAQGPLVIRRIFLNKPMYIVSKLRENYVKGYSPEFLFLYTEQNKIYSIWSRGRIFFLDMIFIIPGIAYLYQVNKRAATFVVLLALIAGLPGMLGGLPYSARNLLLSTVFPVFAAGGLLFVWRSTLISRIRPLVLSILIISYSYLLGSYLFDYYGRYAFYSGEAWFQSLKEVSYNILENKDRYDETIVGTASFGDLLQYAFYAQLNPRDVQTAWQTQEQNSNIKFSLHDISFTTECLSIDEKNPALFQESKAILYIVHESCNKSATPSALIKDYPGNTVWKVYKLENYE